MVRVTRAGSARPALQPMLGPGRCAALERLLLGRAVRWALEVAPHRVFVAYEPADAEAELRSLLGDDRGPDDSGRPGGAGGAGGAGGRRGSVELLAQRGAGVTARVGSAAAHVFAQHSGPVLIVWPELPRWRREHALGALEDLADGCAVSVGPVFDGGFYLLALPAPAAWLAALPDGAWASPDAMGLAIAAAYELSSDAGMLRAERALRRPEDVRAALADPLLDAELGAILRIG